MRRVCRTLRWKNCEIRFQKRSQEKGRHFLGRNKRKGEKRKGGLYSKRGKDRKGVLAYNFVQPSAGIKLVERLV